jgi:hypothetical protein
MKNKKWAGFLINMLGVILAIMLTFGVNALWERHEDKKKTREMLILIRSELKDNKEWFKDQEKNMKKDGYVYKKIIDAKDDLTSIPVDSLKAYYKRIMNLHLNTMTASAWPIFQNSGMIQKMSDKELVIRLADCYNVIGVMCEFTKEYWDTKKKILFTSGNDPKSFFDAAMKNNESVSFFVMFSVDEVSVWKSFTLIDAFIDYIVMLLDKHGDYRYDMDEKDNEVNAFIEARIDSLYHKKDTIQKNDVKSENK